MVQGGRWEGRSSRLRRQTLHRAYRRLGSVAPGTELKHRSQTGEPGAETVDVRPSIGEGEVTEHVIEGAVFQHHDDDVVDLLEVGDMTRSLSSIPMAPPRLASSGISAQAFQSHTVTNSHAVTSPATPVMAKWIPAGPGQRCVLLRRGASTITTCSLQRHSVQPLNRVFERRNLAPTAEPGTGLLGTAVACHRRIGPSTARLRARLLR